MKWASASSTQPSLSEAVAQASLEVFEGLDRQEPDLVLAFISAAHAPQIHQLPKLLRREFEIAVLVGGLGVGVAANGREFEEQAAVSITAAALPEIEIGAIHLSEASMPPVYAERGMWETALHAKAATQPGFILLADPFSDSVDNLLKGLDRNFPQSSKIGGLISGIEQADTPCLILNDEVHESGAVALSLSGNIAIDAIVAQGCRPIGDPMFVTAARDNLVLELDGRAPRDVLAELFNKLSRADRALFTESLFMGIAMTPGRDHYSAGDFLIRTILGIDPKSSALWLNTPLEPNKVVQLHLRDGVTSAQDLEQALKSYCERRTGPRAAGALLFSCLGRGQRLYGHADHDSSALRQHLGDVPLGGLFCNGEIGPVKDTTYLHGYTSVFGIFRNREPITNT